MVISRLRIKLSLFVIVFSVFLPFSLNIVIFHFRFFSHKTVGQVARKSGQ